MNNEEQIKWLEDIIQKIKEGKGIIKSINFEPITREYKVLGMEEKCKIIGSSICFEIQTIK